MDDVSPNHLEALKKGFYETKVVVTYDDAKHIEQQIQDQADSVEWSIERRKRLTASVVGGIAKMRSTTNKAKKVEGLLYTRFRGNVATRYGTTMEDITKVQYETFQRQNGHPDLKVENCGLAISLENPWLAASPDGLVTDPSDATRPLGLIEIKNPHSVRSQTLVEACQKSSFCLENNNDSFKLKTRHDYYYQVQTQLYCTGRCWCDFVLRTDNDLHIERICTDQAWQKANLLQLKEFYFFALLPELACPKHHNGGIREPIAATV